MQRFKIPSVMFALTLLAIPILFTSNASLQQRGQRPVRIPVENGQVIDLYDESHALIIGVSDYLNGWRHLPGVKQDVEQVQAVLQRHGFRVETLLNPTRFQFDERLRTFISEYGLSERNRLLIYFAGHGYTEKLAVDGRLLGYIVPVDAPRPDRDLRKFNALAISMDEMETYALRIRSKHALFVFDSCFSGAMFETMRGRRSTPPLIESKTASPVRFFITAGTEGQEVPDNSIFRAYFVRALNGEGDLNNDGFITGEEMGMYLAGQVARDSRDTQTPRYGWVRNERLNKGDFVFVSPLGSQLGKQTYPPPQIPNIKSRPTPIERHDRENSETINNYPSPPNQYIADSNFFTFELVRCDKSGSIVICELRITNRRQDRHLSLYTGTLGYHTIMVDDLGNRYDAIATQVGTGDAAMQALGMGSGNLLVKGVPTRAGAKFTSVSSDAKKVTLLRLSFICDRDVFNVEFRNVPFNH